MLIARSALARDDQRFQSALPCSLDTGSVCFIRDDDRDARVRNASLVDGIGDGEEIGTASGKENTDLMHFRIPIFEFRSQIACS
jgi:hypothetical protein